MTDKRYFVVPYKQGSASASALAKALGGRVLLLSGSKYKHRPWMDVVINWGNTEPPDPPVSPAVMTGLLNKPSFLRFASNKKNFFELMAAEGLSEITPSFWTSKDAIPDDAFPIVCRTVLAGHSGDGIVIAGCRDDLVPAPLYVKYVKKEEEYRIHVGRNRIPDNERILDGVFYDYPIISVQRKARRNDCPNPNWQIRNHANGFVYVRNDVTPPPSVLEVAQQSFRPTGLDFGAVDVVFNKKSGKAYVLEINTAPGLEGTTVEDYTTFFRSLQ